MPVTAETPNETEHEYMGPLVHVQIPLVTQPVVQYPYQGVQSFYHGMPIIYPGASSSIPQLSVNVALYPVHPGHLMLLMFILGSNILQLLIMVHIWLIMV